MPDCQGTPIVPSPLLSGLAKMGGLAIFEFLAGSE